LHQLYQFWRVVGVKHLLEEIEIIMAKDWAS